MNLRLLHVRLLLLFLLLPLLAACVSQPTAMTRYYILSSADEQTAMAAGIDWVSANIEISALNLPRYLKRAQVVSRPTPNRLEIHESHRWGDDLQRNIERVLAAGLKQQLPNAQIVNVPHMLSDIDYRLLVDIRQFETINQDQLILDSQWTLLASGQSKPLTIKDLRLSYPLADGSSIEQTVNAMSQALRDLAQQIATSLTKSAAKPPHNSQR